MLLSNSKPLCFL